MDKRPWASKSLWFNVAVLAVTFMVDMPAELRALGVPEVYALRVATIANMGLRLISVGRIVFAMPGDRHGG